MKTVKISLIIPAYNEEKYIWDCLKYALENGKWYIDEIIVVNNNSTDKTKEIAESYPWVKVFTEIKKWPTFARQRGYKESTWDVLAFVDSDTHMPKWRAKQIHDQFSKDKTLAVLTGPYVFHDLPWYGFLYSRMYYPAFFSYMMASIFGGICVWWNFAIRRTSLDKMQGFDQSILFYGDDTDIARRWKQHGKVKYMLNFAMPTSARRYQHQWFFSTSYNYAKHYIRTNFFHRPPETEYQDFR
jgi:glycosyltransferase involved in cell wall biosynthesis